MVTAKTQIKVLEACNVSKTFGGIKALDGVDLQVYASQVVAVVGENGAGKSTLGQIVLDGQQVVFANPKEAQDNGIGIIHQELNLIPHLSVAENAFLGREFLNALGLIDYKRMNRETARILEKLGLQIDPRVPVAGLRVGQQQIVEIARVL
ncbi:MAG: ATP-binding cassette domain-containing protein, partial [Planctomycetota bacterium]